jgi:hypothetical protein
MLGFSASLMESKRTADRVGEPAQTVQPTTPTFSLATGGGLRPGEPGLTHPTN